MTLERRRLRAQHFGISDRAVAVFAVFDRVDSVAARAELESILGDAVQSQTDPHRWRLRSREANYDLSIVTRHDDERGHLVVVGMTCRRRG